MSEVNSRLRSMPYVMSAVNCHSVCEFSANNVEKTNVSKESVFSGQRSY